MCGLFIKVCIKYTYRAGLGELLYYKTIMILNINRLKRSHSVSIYDFYGISQRIDIFISKWIFKYYFRDTWVRIVCHRCRIVNRPTLPNCPHPGILSLLRMHWFIGCKHVSQVISFIWQNHHYFHLFLQNLTASIYPYGNIICWDYKLRILMSWRIWWVSKPDRKHSVTSKYCTKSYLRWR